MFKAGDMIVYPNQGVGIIDLIEEQEFHGEMQTFYNIHLINNSLKMKLPSNRIENSSVRLISDIQTLDKILNNPDDYSLSPNELPTNSKERLESNSEKVKSGDLKDYVEVFSSLLNFKSEHTLNSSENRMFNSIKKVLVEEISIVKNISKTEADILLDKKFRN